MDSGTSIPPSVIRSARGDAELVDHAADRALVIERFVDRRRIEVDRRCGSGRRGSRNLQRRLRFREGGMERRRQLHRIAVPENVHVHRERFVTKEMVVKRGDLDSRFLEPRHDGRDFAGEKHEIAHYHRLIARLAECQPRTERERRFDLDAVKGDFEIAARQSYPIDAARHGCAVLTERLAYGVHPFGVGRDGAG